MSITYHERPGVYSDYDTSSVTATTDASDIVAVAAPSGANAGVYTVTSYTSGAAVFGESSELGRLLKLLYQNGAGTVLAYPVAADTEAAYTAAFTALLKLKTARYLVCASTLESVQTAMLTAIAAASEQRGECVGLCGMAADATQAELIARAAALNSERMVLVGTGVYVSDLDKACSGAWGAAAMAGILAAQTDPALPLSGATLKGLSGTNTVYDDTAVDVLVRGGVTLLETPSGGVSVLRAVTTRTKTSGASDTSWRELTTILIIDSVIPAVRTALTSKFTRKKNNATTRSAIRSQVVVELEDRVTREIIESYENVTVSADSTDPTICLVEFSFTVVHGLSRIYLTAHITV